MNTKMITRLLPCVLLAGVVVSAHAEEKKEITIRRVGVEKGATAPGQLELLATRHLGTMEKVAFLGVETSPVGRTLASQLGLARDTGLVVSRIAKDSPAAAVLQEHDILTKFEDQILIDSHQLSVLVRSKKEGEEVKLTVFRGGKETKVTARLAQHEVPVAQAFSLPGGGSQQFNFRVLGPDGQAGGMAIPGLGREDVDNVVRMIGREQGQWFAQPRVHVLRRAHGGAGSTILDMTKGNFVFSDETGTIELNATDGKRELTVKGEKGEVLFKGPINSEEDKKKLPADVLARLKKVEGVELDLELGEDFEQGAATVEDGAPKKVQFERVQSAPSAWRLRSL